MKKRLQVILFLCATVFSLHPLRAQVDSAQKSSLRIGIFAPLYLDSVFSNNTFRYKQSMPRFIVPAVDFIRGTQLALDSLQAGSDYIQATIYDSKS
ncbi:MAG TPA: hypothetical protein PKD93_15180, partial [Ferruginibacter sp.]|nr:hypothetical protein [Ferruginibacter sp.]